MIDSTTDLPAPESAMDSLTPMSMGNNGECDCSPRLPRNISPPIQARISFKVPPSEQLELARLAPDVRTTLFRRLAIMEQIHHAPNPRQGALQQAAIYGHLKGYSAPRLRALYDQYLRTRDWRVLLDKAKAGRSYWETSQEDLPEEFLEHWRQLCQENQRKCEPAHRALIRQWLLWRRGDPSKAIPGYDSPPSPDPATDIPKGWHYGNLMRRKNKPTKFELAAARIGRSAASEFRPKVLMNREGLSVGEYYAFDDLWHDFKVVVGERQRHAQRLLQFHAIDLFSGCNIARGYKPVLENEMTGAQERLKEAEMIFLVAHVLGNIGYRSQGTTLIVEHGTAAIREDLEKLLSDLTGGIIKVERSGIEGSPAWAGVYAGRPKGNFRFKAALESLGNLIHNETANILDFPGQTGSNARLNLPEELYGRERHADQLIRAIVALPPEVAQLLRLPFLSYQRAVWLCEAIHERINSRTEHDLEGWLKAGLTCDEWRLSPELPWLPTSKLLDMPADKRAAVDAVITSSPNLVRIRKLSPAEVFQSGKSGLVKLPPEAIAIILATVNKRPVSVRNNLLTFDDASLSPESLHYEPIIGPGERLKQDTKWDLVVNPFDLSKAFIFDSHGRYVGTVPAWNGVCRSDTEALHRACGRAAKAEAELLAPVAARGATLTRQRIEDARHNAAILAGNPKTPEEKAILRRVSRETGSIDDILTASIPAGETSINDPLDQLI